MKHFTCDKCGMPMETERSTRIDDRRYNLCADCDLLILKNLDGKGEKIYPQEFEKFKSQLEKFKYPGINDPKYFVGEKGL